MKELNCSEISMVSGGHPKSQGQIVAEAIVTTAAVVVAGPGVGAFILLAGFIASNIGEV